MNKKILLSIITAVFLMSGCGKAAPANAKSPSAATAASEISNKISDTSVPAVPSSSQKNTSSDSETGNNKNHLALDAYKKVLQNKAEFFSSENKKNTYLNDFLNGGVPGYDVKVKVTHFAVLDMDGDKAPEVVLELSVSGEYPDFYEVLHYTNSVVYGYNFVLRALGGLKTDGTFTYSNSAADNGFGKLEFDSDAYKIDILGYQKPSNDNDMTNISYFIDNKQVTKDSYNSFIYKQNGKKDVDWYEFSQNNIEKELSINP